MFLARLGLKNSVGVILLTLLAVVLGILSVGNIPVSFWPEFTAPALIISVPYPGASPEEIEEQIARPLEKALNTINGIDELESYCARGYGQFFVRFNWDTDFDKIKLKVQEMTNQASFRFPEKALQPTILQVKDFLPPGLEIGFYSDTRDLSEVREFVEKKLEGYFLHLENAAATKILGGYQPEIQVNLDPVKLVAMGISTDQVIEAIRNRNIARTVGHLETDKKSFAIRVYDKYNSLEDVKRTVITNRERSPVTLEDIAEVRPAPSGQGSITRWNGREIVILSLREKSGANTTAMCEAGRKRLKSIKELIPEDIHAFILSDQSLFIKRAIRNIGQKALFGAGIAGIIVLLFLGNLRNFLIIFLSIPVSLISAFFLIKLFGLSINIISLGGLALAVGLIVDASVIVAENIFRRLREESSDRRETVLNATSEVSQAVIACTLTSLVVFLPLVFLTGLFDVLLGELALTVVFTLTISALVALCLVPLLSLRFIKTLPGDSEEKGLQKIFNSGFNTLKNFYTASVGFAIRKPLFTLFIAFLILAVTIVIAIPFLDVKLLPAVNENEFTIDIQLPEGSNLDYTSQITRRLEKKLKRISELEQVCSIIGIASEQGEKKANFASLRVRVKDKFVGKIPEIIDTLRIDFSRLPVSRIKIAQADAAAGFRREAVNIRISGYDMETLSRLGKEVQEKLRGVEGIVNVAGNIREKLTEFRIDLKNERLSAYGITPLQAAAALNTALDGISPAVLSQKGREYDIHVRYKPETITEINDILNLPIYRIHESIIPLRAVTSVHLSNSPVEIKRFNQQRFVNVTADVSGRPYRETLADVKTRMLSVILPPGYSLTYGEQSKGLTDSFRSLIIALLIAFALIYVVLGIQFNSFVYPLIIGITIPLGVVGVILGLLMFRLPISINALLGTIMLVGLVVNNGILLIDRINFLRNTGQERSRAIIGAGENRLRPILITSLTTILGILPISLGIGIGGEALQPLGAVVVGGLTTSTFLTLLVIPAAYILIDNLRKKPADKSPPQEEQTQRKEPLLPYV